MKVLVLDLVHGGEVLARAYAERGDDVTAVDVYRTSPAELRDGLDSMGIRVLESPGRALRPGRGADTCPDRFFGASVCAEG